MTSHTTTDDLAAAIDPLDDGGLDHCDSQLRPLDRLYEMPLRSCRAVDYPLITRRTICQDNPARPWPATVSVHQFRRLSASWQIRSYRTRPATRRHILR